MCAYDSSSTLKLPKRRRLASLACSEPLLERRAECSLPFSRFLIEPTASTDRHRTTPQMELDVLFRGKPRRLAFFDDHLALLGSFHDIARVSCSPYLLMVQDKANRGLELPYIDLLGVTKDKNDLTLELHFLRSKKRNVAKKHSLQLHLNDNAELRATHKALSVYPRRVTSFFVSARFNLHSLRYIAHFPRILISPHSASRRAIALPFTTHTSRALRM
jgi:hypothetical protein